MDDDETYSTPVASTLVVMTSLGFTTQGGVDESAPTIVTLSPIFLASKGEATPTWRSETMKLFVLINRIAVIAMSFSPTYRSETAQSPVLMNRVVALAASTPVRGSLTFQGSSPHI